MSYSKNDAQILKEECIKEEICPSDAWLDIKEETVEYSAEADAVRESWNQESGDGSITDSEASVCKESYIGINPEVMIKEEVEYSASCDTTPTKQQLMEDLPHRERKRTSPSKQTSGMRRRNLNWTADETLLLVHLVKEKKDIIKGKFSVNLTYKDKRAAWKQITKDINAAFPLVVRTVKQVEKRWYNCYQKGREKLKARKKAFLENGVGPLDQIAQVSDPILDIIQKVMRPNSFPIGIKINDTEHIINSTDNRAKTEIMQTSGGDPLEMETAKILSIISHGHDDVRNHVNSHTQQRVKDVPVVTFECDGELVEHSYAIPKRKSSSVVTNTTQVTPQRNTTHTPSQHTTTPTSSQHTTTPTSSQLFKMPPPSPPTATLTPQDHTAATGSSHSSLKQLSTDMSSQKKCCRVGKFKFGPKYKASLDFHRRERKLKIRDLEMSIKLKEEAFCTVQKFNKVADLLLEKFQ